MHRFHLPPAECSGPVVTLTGREAHHGLRVLRLRGGESVVVLDGAGREMECEVAATGRDSIRLAVKRETIVPPPPFQLTLLQAIPKGKSFDLIIQKATELGAGRIVPVLSERVVVQLDDARSGSKAMHWRSTAVESIKQCGAAWLPGIDAPLTPAAFIARGERFDLPLVASLEPGSRHPREHFDAFRVKNERPPRSVCVWVGPEGDFTAAEIAAIRNAGAQPISLGPRVLRSETAAIYCLSILSYELQALDVGPS